MKAEGFRAGAYVCLLQDYLVCSCFYSFPMDLLMVNRNSCIHKPV